MIRKENTNADLKHYSRVLDKLIKMYRVATGLSKEEFRDRFWNNEVREHLGCFQSFSSTDQKLLNIYHRTDLSEENKAFQQMAVALGWKCRKACRYLLWETVYEMFYQIKCIDKTKVNGFWQSKAKPHKFEHPLYVSRKGGKYEND